jgi:hypothetical protein
MLPKINNSWPSQGTSEHLPSNLAVLKDACDLTVNELRRKLLWSVTNVVGMTEECEKKTCQDFQPPEPKSSSGSTERHFENNKIY